MTYHRDRPDDWRELAACAGQGPLFASVEPADHLEARAICHTCPALAFQRCRDLAEQLDRELVAAHGGSSRIVGTWAGVLHGVPRRPGRPKRVAA